MEKVNDDKPICIIEVNENLRRVELGLELTRPLRQLNKNCLFKEKYEMWCNIQEGLDINADIKKIEVKAQQKTYYQRPEVKARQKAYQKAYHQRPEVKAQQKTYKKTYYQRPEVKARQKAYHQRRKNKKWKKI